MVPQRWTGEGRGVKLHYDSIFCYVNMGGRGCQAPLDSPDASAWRQGYLISRSSTESRLPEFKVCKLSQECWLKKRCLIMLLIMSNSIKEIIIDNAIYKIKDSHTKRWHPWFHCFFPSCHYRSCFLLYICRYQNCFSVY